MNLVWILRLGKNKVVYGLQTENKMKKKRKKNSLKHWATGFKVLG